MKYKVQYVNGKMAEFEADKAELKDIGNEDWLLLYNLSGFFDIFRDLVVAIKTSSLWKVTTEEANETLIKDDHGNQS